MSEMPSHEPQHNYFLIIPASITDDPDIDDSTAILFGRIAALSNQKGYCWASDDYLSKLTRVGEREVRNRLKTLEDKGYIVRKTQKNGFSWDRKIYPQFQINRTKGIDVPLDTAEVCLSKRNVCAEEQDKLNIISNNNNTDCSVVVPSDESLKKELLDKSPLSSSVKEKSMLNSLDSLRIALDCLRYGSYTDPNAFFWSALKEGWRPNYPKEMEQQQQNKDNALEEQLYEAEKSERLINEMKGFMLHTKGLFRKTCGFDYKNGDILCIADGEIKNKPKFDDEGLRYMQIFFDKYKA